MSDRITEQLPPAAQDDDGLEQCSLHQARRLTQSVKGRAREESNMGSELQPAKADVDRGRAIPGCSVLGT